MPSATSLSPRQVKPRSLSPLNHWQNTLTHCILSSNNTVYWSSSLNILPSEPRHGGFSSKRTWIECTRGEEGIFKKVLRLCFEQSFEQSSVECKEGWTCLARNEESGVHLTWLVCLLPLTAWSVTVTCCLLIQCLQSGHHQLSWPPSRSLGFPGIRVE